MMDILHNIIAFLVTLGVLITFHEFGHYWVARRFDVKIQRFSIGFGRTIYNKRWGQDDTEFVVAALPLGGYVKMLDEREEQVATAELPRAFNRKPLWQRSLIVCAGPVFNFIFAVFAYWIVFMLGINGLKPIIGEVETPSIAAEAGFVMGDEVLAVNDVKTPTWSTLLERLVTHTVTGDRVNMVVLEQDGAEKTVALDFSKISIDEMTEGQLLEILGLSIVKLNFPAIIDQVVADGAAQRSGLLKYDKIISVNGILIDSWAQWVGIIRKNPQQRLIVQVLREDSMLDIALIPAVVQGADGLVGRIGATVLRTDDLLDTYFTKEVYSLPQALLKGIQKTWEMSVLTLRLLGKMLVGEVSLKNLSGPISIAQYAGQSANIGLIAFLEFIALVSVSLGVLNLLPIPMLDGGHLLAYFVEWVIGKPLSESTQMVWQQMGLFLLLGLMSIAFYNDIMRLIG